VTLDHLIMQSKQNWCKQESISPRILIVSKQIIQSASVASTPTSAVTSEVVAGVVILPSTSGLISVTTGGTGGVVVEELEDLFLVVVTFDLLGISLCGNGANRRPLASTVTHYFVVVVVVWWSKHRKRRVVRKGCGVWFSNRSVFGSLVQEKMSDEDDDNLFEEEEEDDSGRDTLTHLFWQ
jgi:hypothetical protein